ncbi:MAG: glycoside hydrolase 43 family protein [Paludibacteraceae bacterium]|nr:glycoside hydrolase 43 family protein [Paludibacteraceae bacterium]
MKQIFLTLALCLCAGIQAQVSKAWVADQGDGTYKNPILYADYSDPDVCRVGDDYYMTSSSFGCVPALQILHSKDLVNWTIIGAAIPHALPPVSDTKPMHGMRVWAPCIRHHNGMFYIFWGDPDQGIFMVKTEDVKGTWSEPVLVKQGKGLIDSSPLWDDDGRVYLVHAYAGSRAGLKSVIAICELNADATKAITPSRIIFDGHEAHETCEGPKFYKRNGYYYIFHPAGGVPTGWQVVQRSKNIYGPYEWRKVLEQGTTSVNGPHQGAWVDTPEGEDWFFHFQDVGAMGRLVHLQPMHWHNDWPVMGLDKDGDGCGEPVLQYRKPKVTAKTTLLTPQDSDEFDEGVLGWQWQWHANVDERWYFADAANSKLRLYSFPVVSGYKSLWDVPNLLLQKLNAPSLTATAKINFSPIHKYKGERAGMVLMGMDYSALVLTNTPEGLQLQQVECIKADKGATETIVASIPAESSTIYLRLKVHTTPHKIKESEGGHDHLVKAHWTYSYDGKKFHKIGNDFTVKEGKWIGAKMGLFCTRPHIVTNDGGWMDVDWFRVEK